MRARFALALLIVAACEGRAPELVPGERRELVHPGAAHELHLSEPALAVGPDGAAYLAFARGEGGAQHVWVTRLAPGEPPAPPLRVDPQQAPPGAMHQAPGLAVGPGGAVHLSWSTPAGGHGSELVVISSRDGGRTFGAPRRLGAGPPATRGFEGLAVDGAGALYAAWIEIGAGPPRTLLARLPADAAEPPALRELGTRTCPCCRIAVSAGDGVLGVLWRDEFPGQVRDMVLAVSRDGGASFGAAARVHEDGWALAACPHRGGALAIDAAGGALAAWYTEGRDARPALHLAAAPDGARFGPPLPLHDLPGALPDRVALALRPDGAGLVAFESATSVRREIAVRAVAAGGARLGPTQVLSRVVKANGPAAAAAPSGELVLAWNEEEFPVLRTVVQTLALPADGAAPRRAP